MASRILFFPSSPLKTVTLSSSQYQRLRSSELKVVLEALDANHTLKILCLPCKVAAILKQKERISKLLRNNSSLKELHLKDSHDKNFFTRKQTEEICESLAPPLLLNHSLLDTDLVDYDENAAQRLLDLNRKGVIAAAAGKGVPLPSSFVKGLVDSAVPDALKKVSEKVGLAGTFSFLQQIHFGNLITANIGHSLTTCKKRLAKNQH